MLQAIFSLFHSLFKRLALQTCKDKGFFGKVLCVLNGVLGPFQHFFSHITVTAQIFRYFLGFTSSCTMLGL